MKGCVAAIDQGTTSSRCLVFDHDARVAGMAQAEHRQYFPRPGWVEHDAGEIRDAVFRLLVEAAGQTSGRRLEAIGIANQRETLVVWDRQTGEPYGRAIVWQDTRTRELCEELARDGGQDRFREATGLPLATYFTGPKLAWRLEHEEGLRSAAAAGQALAGTIDSWLIWNLTGGPAGGVHVTDVTNASRTLLMNLSTLAWDEGILEVLGIPVGMLPRIVGSNAPEAWGYATVEGRRVPVCAALGDQQAALFGQGCFAAGSVKNTYGTGCFMLLNTGPRIVPSTHGLLTTVARQLAGEEAVYALEGSVAMAGSLVQWLRDNLGLIESSSAIEALAASVEDSGGIYVVPAFSGLFAPYWRADARGVIVGLTHYIGRAHLARAVLEATAYQVRDVLDAMVADAGLELDELKVDGGMTRNGLLMQFQADLLDKPVIRPANVETTALGAAFAAGLATGFWGGLDELAAHWQADSHWEPALEEDRRDRMLAGWREAVQRSFGLAR